MTELDVDDLATLMAALLIAAGYDADEGAQIAACMVADEMESGGGTVH
jgi:hypothetical protein